MLPPSRKGECLKLKAIRLIAFSSLFHLLLSHESEANVLCTAASSFKANVTKLVEDWKRQHTPAFLSLKYLYSEKKGELSRQLKIHEGTLPTYDLYGRERKDAQKAAESLAALEEFVKSSGNLKVDKSNKSVTLEIGSIPRVSMVLRKGNLGYDFAMSVSLSLPDGPLLELLKTDALPVIESLLNRHLNHETLPTLHEKLGFLSPPPLENRPIQVIQTANREGSITTLSFEAGDGHYRNHFSASDLGALTKIAITLSEMETRLGDVLFVKPVESNERVLIVSSQPDFRPAEETEKGRKSALIGSWIKYRFPSDKTQPGLGAKKVDLKNLNISDIPKIGDFVIGHLFSQDQIWGTSVTVDGGRFFRRYSSPILHGKVVNMTLYTGETSGHPEHVYGGVYTILVSDSKDGVARYQRVGLAEFLTLYRIPKQQFFDQDSRSK